MRSALLSTIRPLRLIPIVWTALLASCLSPLADDAIDPSRVFGKPMIDPESALHVEDNPMLRRNVAQFSTSVAYVKGFADRQPIWYWNVDGPNKTFIAPMFEIVTADGSRIGRAIIDVLPGDTGYTPWWRRVVVRTTSKYRGERIWSREAIDAGIRLGLLEQPVETDDVIDCPVVRRATKIPVDIGQSVDPEWTWYRNQRVHWIEFTAAYKVPIGVREMPTYPVYVLQRINQSQPLYELATGVDINNDGDLKDTNNIFASNIGGPRYSPLWYTVWVRTVASYPSFDTPPFTIGLSAERDFLGADESIISPLVVPNGVTEMRSVLVNCPIQRAKGML